MPEAAAVSLQRLRARVRRAYLRLVRARQRVRAWRDTSGPGKPGGRH